MIKVKLSELKTINDRQVYYWEKKEKLINDVYLNGFDYKKGCIKITSDFYIIDGHHRCRILGDKFGTDYEVYVKQLIINRFVYIFILSSVLILLSPLIIIYMLIKYGIERSSKRH